MLAPIILPDLLSTGDPTVADITSPRIRVFANEKARPFADAMESTYLSAVAFRDEWDAADMGTLIPNTADRVADGSETDGRKPCTGAQLHQLYAAATANLTWFETGTPTRIYRIRQLSVNARSRF